MNVGKYIERIDYHGKLSVDHDCLRHLHRCHVMSVPFENMDIQLHRKIKLDPTSLYDKVVLHNRGGFCYELNYLFYSLLNEIGFNTSMISARIFENDSYGPPFDHMSILVELDTYWLVDVGYGDLFMEPLKIYATGVQKDSLKKYRIEQLNDGTFLLLESLADKQEYLKRYIFELQARTIDEFSNQCEYKQSSPDSYFVQNTICTIPMEHGRKTIFNDLFKIRDNGKVREAKIGGADNLLRILKDEFNITMDNKESYAVQSH
ncbi:MAG: arylamine N-acetyltransferase [Flavobacteriaceae bacterium]